MRKFSRSIAILALIATPTFAQRGRGPGGGGDVFRFRFVGPIAGNRVASFAGVPGDINTYYAGAASGGIFKSVDGGYGWTPIFDDQPVAAIGSLAVAPSNHSIVWAGTGEAWAIRDSDVTGNGIYRSNDAGRTWQHMGLDETGRIGRIVIHPTDPNIVYACALGRLTGPQQERGVFRTTDGGAHWQRVLFVDENTGCSGLSMDAKNPQKLFAGTWQAEMHTYGMFSGGPGSGVYTSHDGGATWSRITSPGLPKSPLGKIDVAVAPTNSDRVYALIQTADQGSMWRSDDGGTNWRVVNWDRALIGRAGYYIHLAVSPANENEVFVSNSSFHASLDGGETFRPQPWGGDNHDIWWDPTNPDRFVITHDAGLSITTSHGRGFNRVTLPVGQMYHVSVDNQIPYYFYSNMQDSTTMRGPSVQVGFGGFGRAAEPGWDRGMGGCESGFTYADPTDTNIVWATCYGDEVTRWDAKTKLARSVSPWLHTLDSPPNDAKYRCHWTAPLAIDPFDHNSVYYGCQVIFKTTNGGQSWNIISPDLSKQDPKYIVPSGGIVGDNLGQFYGEVVFAIAPSTVQKNLIWAGTNDGKIWYTKDGKAWNDVTKNVGMKPWGTITSIQPSFFDAGTAYISVDYHLMDDREPFLYKTTDFGATWTKITTGLPSNQLSYVRIVCEDPNQKGLLFAGTGNAIYYSLNDGGQWTKLNAGLPPATVSWAVVQKQAHDLVVSTYGRGIYILDDISPLEAMAKGVGSDTSVSLFPPRPTMRIVGGGRAYLNYQLKNQPKGPVQAAILDENGKVLRDFRNAPSRQGLNRVSWDLRFDPPHLVALRTTPEDNPHIWEEPRFRGQDARPITHWGAAQAEVGPVAAPGKYTMRITVDGESYTQPLEIIRDPSSHGSDDDLRAQMKLQSRIRDDINAAADMVNQLEWMRKQLDDIQKMLRADRSKANLLKSVQEMDQKMQKVEYKLITKALSTSDDKYFIAAYNVYFNLIWLNGEVGTGAGDVAGGADYGPTDTALSLTDMIEKDLAAARTEYRSLMDKDVPAFNKSLAANGVTPISANN
ncbi:MAG: sialidase [Acidobacteriia bacterium]|nr:sialidase [Terriglobia bacterium]